MANRKRVLSIEIGNSLIKIVEMDYKAKNPKVYRCISIKSPANILQDGMLEVTPELITALTGGLAGQGITTKQVIFTVTSPRIASREVQIPNIKRNKIEALIKENAMDYFPIDLQQYEIGYHFISNNNNKTEANARIKIMALAVPKVLLEGYQTLAAECGLEIVAFDYGSNSIYQILKNECAEDVTMVVKIDGNSTNVIVLNAGEVALQRTLPYGVAEIIETMLTSKEYGAFKYREAVAMFRKQVCIDAKMPEKMGAQDVDSTQEAGAEAKATENEGMAAARREITAGFGNLVGSILRVMDYYNSRNAEAPIQRGFLTGLAGDFLGLDVLLSNCLEVEVTALTDTNMVSLTKGNENASFGEYIACLGAVIDPVGLLEKEADGTSANSKLDYDFLSLCVLIAGVGAGVLLCGLAFLQYNTARLTQTQLENKLVSLRPAQNVYDEYVAAKAQYDKYQYLYGYTQNPNEQLVEFINELEEILPSSFYTNSFSSDEAGITMSVTVEGKEAAAATISNIRNMESIADVSVSSISESEGTDGKAMVSFSISATYRDVTEEE